MKALPVSSSRELWTRLVLEREEAQRFLNLVVAEVALCPDPDAAFDRARLQDAFGRLHEAQVRVDKFKRGQR